MPEADPTGLTALEGLLGDGLEIEAVHHDSRQVEPRSLYACLRGGSFDGHDYAADAVAAGAVALLVDRRIDGVGEVAQIIVDDTRRRLGPIAARVYGHPSRRLRTVGITGTNGKTTTAHLLAAVFEAAGLRTGIVGTLHGPRTTPEAPELQRTLAGFVDDGLGAAVLEVSSHALELHRADGTEFDAVVFTNLGHDHLDLHGSQEAYFRAKASLFSPRFAPIGVINVDDTHGRLLADSVADTDFAVVPYSVAELDEVTIGAEDHHYRWGGVAVDVPIGGTFNVANSLAALTTAVAIGIDVEVAAGGLAGASPVPGRFEVVSAGRRSDITVVVDYAHTPEGLEHVLASARRAADGGHVAVVFGCGGDRDRDKRPEMGAVAARDADGVVITSDNPRHDEPLEIIDEIVAGIDQASRGRCVIEPDRERAITGAIHAAPAGAVVVVAGKGHERTQEFADHVVEFDDREVARAALETRP